jgi:hypothetical protein
VVNIPDWLTHSGSTQDEIQERLSEGKVDMIKNKEKKSLEPGTIDQWKYMGT